MIVVYARFSPRPRAAECESCDVQIRDARKWAAEQGAEIRDEFRDDDRSGVDDNRPGLRDALKACKRGDIFLVRDFDRLSRDNHARLGYAFALTRRGVRLVSLTEGEYKPADKENKLLFGILAALGSYRRDVIREATSTKMRQHQANGRAMGGKPPYGTVREGKLLVQVPEQQAWIPQIVAWRKEGLSYREICRRLDEGGAPREGKRWRVDTVKGVLRRAGAEV